MASRKKPRDSRRPSAVLARATALWQERRFDEALRQFNEAVRMAPNDLSVLVDAGRALGARYQLERSESLLAKASRLGSRRADVLHAVGESYRMLGRSREAEACFRRANLLALSPTQVRSPSYEEVARPLFTTSIGRWQNDERQLAPALDALAPLVDALGYER